MTIGTREEIVARLLRLALSRLGAEIIGIVREFASGAISASISVLAEEFVTRLVRFALSMRSSVPVLLSRRAIDLSISFVAVLVDPILLALRELLRSSRC